MNTEQMRKEVIKIEGETFDKRLALKEHLEKIGEEIYDFSDEWLGYESLLFDEKDNDWFASNSNLGNISIDEFIKKYQVREEFPEIGTYTLKGPGYLRCALAFIEDDEITRHGIAKEAYEDGVNVTWELKDQHASIRAEYEAVEDKRFVKVLSRPSAHSEWKEGEADFVPFLEYRLQYYCIDWMKVLAWYYTHKKLIECEFSDDHFEEYIHEDAIVAFYDGAFCDKEGSWYRCCRLSKNITPLDEWLIPCSKEEA